MEYPLVTTAWLEANLFEGNLVLLDASMQSVVGKEPILYDEFVCIPRSQKFDIEQVFCDTTSSQLHAMPTPEQFEQGATALGIDRDSLVVIYDNQGIYSAPRAWWMFKLMGHENVYVLDGGLPQWLSEERMTSESYQPTVIDEESVPYVADFQPGLICDANYVLDSLGGDSVILDARAAGRFAGEVSEPRPGVRCGHIPGSVNLPFGELLREHRMKRVEDLQAMFEQLVGEQVGEQEAERIFSCGSGITACILILASVASGHDKAVLYDGSWADWGSNADLPIEQGA
ncbi:sulfurtransferase [Shewanella alkalitolerans]|uniref:sulfurtransferase n=1 Tax=Shewanella alkalitolerans TaxID=2864209 RepID=UPI001C65A38A|nr:sulfurtransferase [Shewanella alkalitolerans]QYJ99571.1 sulfurtransferase [Shewanella alkalitolerans]